MFVEFRRLLVVVLATADGTRAENISVLLYLLLLSDNCSQFVSLYNPSLHST